MTDSEMERKVENSQRRLKARADDLDKRLQEMTQIGTRELYVHMHMAHNIQCSWFAIITSKNTRYTLSVIRNVWT